MMQRYFVIEYYLCGTDCAATHSFNQSAHALAALRQLQFSIKRSVVAVYCYT